MRLSLPQPLPSVIIVDDSADLVRVYSKFLEMAGFIVLATFFNGKDLVDYFLTLDKTTEKAEAARESIVLMDYRMPEMNGVEAAEQLRKLADTSLSIVLITGEEISELSIPRELFDGMLRKPFSMDDIFSVLQHLSSNRKGINNRGNSQSQKENAEENGNPVESAVKTSN